MKLATLAWSDSRPNGPRRIYRTLVVCFLTLLQASAARAQVDFDRQIAPIFTAHCLDCHSSKDPEAALALEKSDAALRGGDSGPAIHPGNAAESLIWQRVVADEMPPKHPLDDAEKKLLKQWIDEGARWGTDPIDVFAVTTSTRGGRDWWSLQPLTEIEPPKASNEDQPWIRNPIDAFVLEGMRQADLQPAPEADPRTLIRRLYFDLVGLPPSPEQVEAFAANPTEAAYQDMVNRLLASEHYGQRWARHWLDVVRYGESDGFERNNPREHAWRYRDWIVNALNADLPYDRFVQMQLIGDQLVGGTEGAAATGFWVAGVHNTVVGGSKRMKQLARQDELEEVLAVVGQTFVGLTINCARCHDHKFDPVTQKEYYQLASAISGLGYGERVEQSPEGLVKLKQLDDQLTELRAELSEIDQAARSKILDARKSDGSSSAVKDRVPPTAFARWEFDDSLNDSIGELHGTSHGAAKLEGGALVLDGKSYVATPTIPVTIAQKTLEVVVQLGTSEQAGGAAISIETPGGGVFDAIVFAEREPRRWMAGNNSFVRYDSFQGTDESEAVDRPVHIAFVFETDGTITAYRDGHAYGKSIRKSDLHVYSADQSEILFGLRHRPEGGNRFLQAKIHRAALYDRALSAEEVEIAFSGSEFVSEEQILAALNDERRERRSVIQQHIAELNEDRKAQESVANQTLFTLMPGPGEETRVLLRGDPDNADEIVRPAGVSAVPTVSADFGLAADSPEALRRQALAKWITHHDNPLFSRVIVNRLWHYHFGRGIVETPNDLGFNGGRPSHVGLLNYLARDFRDNGYHQKQLHQLIVTSSTYRQSAEAASPLEQQKNKSLDAENRLLWHGPSRRLEAESIRDAMLRIAGVLSEQTGGPSFKDVSVTENNGTNYYEPIDVSGDAYWRRTLYRFNPRGGRSALLDTFDCPDPSASAPRRAVTTTPLQALSLLNNAFVLRMSDAFAARLRAESSDDIQRIQRAWQLAISRTPTDSELRLSKQLVQQHGLEALCRSLFNINEFVRID